MMVEEKHDGRNSRKLISQITVNGEGSTQNKMRLSPLTPPLVELCLLTFTRQFHQLGTKHSRVRAYGVHSHPNHCDLIQLKKKPNISTLFYNWSKQLKKYSGHFEFIGYHISFPVLAYLQF